MKAVREAIAVLTSEIVVRQHAVKALRGLVPSQANGTGKRTVSASTRRKMAAAQRARWAKERKRG